MEQKICNKELSEVLERYFEDRCNPDEEALVQEWLNNNIANPQYDFLFEDLLSRISPDYDSASFRRSADRIERFISVEQSYCLKRKKFRRLITLLSTAAAAAFIAFFSMLFTKGDAVQWYEAYAKRGETQRLTLSDGTSLWLNSDTKVIYPSRFESDKRTIYVDGEIYADVIHDNRRPFIVSASDIHVKVHGTQFSLKAFAEMDNVEVALIKGSVTLEDSNCENGFSRTLKPGELVRYNKTYGTTENYSIDTATYGAWHNNHNIRFINQSLADIAEYLEKRFDVKIVIEDESLAGMQYYASFVNNEGLDKILNALNSNKTMSISKKYDTIIISPNH